MAKRKIICRQKKKKDKKKRKKNKVQEYLKREYLRKFTCFDNLREFL